MLLTIETSCDETAVAILDYDHLRSNPGQPQESLRADIISSQVKVHEPYGGVVPELAARHHATNLPQIVERALQDANCALSDISALAVTRGPGLKGCLLVGVCYAKACALGLGVPLLTLNHLEGHLAAGLLLPVDEQPKFPSLALLVSGGHTLLVLIHGFRDYQVIAETRDDAAGEAFDKIATLLGLPYPGGPALSKAALNGNPHAFHFPIGVAEDDHSFSFSGLKTAVLKCVRGLKTRIEDPQVVADVAASAEHSIVEALLSKASVALRSSGAKSFFLTGGVAANKVLRERGRTVAADCGAQFAVVPPRWCTDNAAMMSILAAGILAERPEEYSNWNSSLAGEALGPNSPLDLAVVSRWPIQSRAASSS